MRIARSGKRKRRVGLLGAVALFIGMIPGFVVASASPASAFTGSNFVSFTLEGCRNDGTITLPIGGKFVCPDAAYTTGNLGKGWNELDLVPHRLTTSSGNQSGATTDYSVYIAADYQTGGKTGYDVISVPVVNTAKSDASCTVTAGAEQTQGTAAAPFGGGTDVVRYRELTIHQAKNTTCVLDYYQRLALGAHLYSGSSLQSYMFEQSGLTGGKKTISIPVNQILPQSISKDMTASQGSDHIWDIVKSPTPATLSFTNTCDASGALSQGFSVTVTWTKRAATPSGPVTIITHVYATNPAARVITTSVTDSIRSGTTQIDSATATVNVAANSANVLLLTHQTTAPAGTTSLNDVATATYTDLVTGVPVPGTTTATASATPTNTGPELNGTAVINDLTSITGSNLSFSLDSFSGATGAFDNGYVAGTATTSPVSWTSDSQSGSGSVTLNGTAYVDSATVTSGTIHDVATLTGSDAFSTSASGDVTLSSSATTSLNVSKTTSLSIGSAQTFTFHLYDGSNTATGDTATVEMPASSNGPVTSSTISGLSATGTYYFKEDGTAPYAPQTTSSVTFSLTPGDLTTCSRTINVSNQAAPATAQVRKDTVPTSSGLWTFTLTGPGGLSETLTNVQANAGTYTAFAASLDSDGGTYTITETPQTGYDLTNVVGDLGGNAGRVSTDGTALTCSFTLDLTTDSGKTFECTFTNTQRGHIIVKKVTDPSGSSQSFDFTPSYGSGFSLTDGQSNDSGLLQPGAYSVAESATAGWDLTSATCDNGDSPGSITLAAGATVTCTFTNTQRGSIIVKKVTSPTGATGSFTFSGDAAGSIGDGGTIVVGNLQPGTYTSAEADPTPAYDLTAISCDDSASATASSGSLSTRTATFKLDPGETVTCTFTNRQRGHAQVVKTVNGAAPTGSQAFVFQLRSGASASAAGTTLATGTANAANGGVVSFSTYLVPGQTYQLCEQLMPGWLTTLGPPLFTAYNPSGDNSVVCADFTVTAGQTKVFSIDNTPPPGGRALTIGFWKNWASCAGSNGKQKPVLDQTLLAAALAGKAITIGTLVLDPGVLTPSIACKDAVNLLNKSTLSGKKMASDPLYNMAAQLVAADLNIVAGAGACSSAVSAINSAQALLAAYHFDGNGYWPKLSAGDVTLANSLATTLDRYNNNLLC